jgi:hypothetical protein
MSEQEEHEGVKRGATGGQESRRATSDIREERGGRRQRTEGTSERKQCVVQKGSGGTPSHRTAALHVHDGQLRAHGGWEMGSEEGGRGRKGKKRGEAGRTDPFGGTSGA